MSNQNIDMEKIIARINALAEKKKNGTPLTDEEQAEKKELYKIYLDVIRGNIKQQLDRVEFVEEEPYETQNEGTSSTH